MGRHVEPSQDDNVFRTMMRQLIDICHANQRHLACLSEEIVDLRSQVSVLVARALQAHQGAESLPGVPPPRPDVPLTPTENRRVAQPPQGRQGSSQSQQSRVCRRAGCSTVVPQVVAFSIARHIAQAQDVGSMVRVPVTRNEVVVIQGVDQQCIHSAPVVIVSPIAQVRGVPIHRNRDQCAIRQCRSLPAPGCLAGCCAAHCNHRQCSHISGNPRARVRPVSGDEYLQVPFVQ